MHALQHPTTVLAEAPAQLAVESIAAINEVVVAAVASWPMAPRVKRLVTPSYRYTREDFDHFAFYGAHQGDALFGIAAVDASPNTAGAGPQDWLLHGLFVLPEVHGLGIGSRLVGELRTQAIRAGVRRLLVKAERHAIGFFEKQGFRLLEVTDPSTDYPFRLSLDLAELR